MIIFNKNNFQVVKYVLHEAAAEKDSVQNMYEPIIELYGKDFSTDTMIIEFAINFYVGENDELLIEYESLYQFKFESESYSKDISSLINVLQEMYYHTEVFFERYGFMSFKQIELNQSRDLDKLAAIGIENLRANNGYKF